MTGEPLKPDVAAAIAAWKPRQRDPRTQNVVAPAVRSMVTTTAPETVALARVLLSGVCPMLVWTDQTLGSLAAQVINPRNIDVFIIRHSKKRSPGWKLATRANLRRVGRAVNPQAWGGKPTQLARSPLSLPYDADFEQLLQTACRLPGASDPAARLWIVAASCGVGMRGCELGASGTGDVQEWGNGRLAVQVRGCQPRLVPVRESWTDAVRQAVASAGKRGPGFSRNYLIGHGHGAVGDASRVSGVQGFSLRRARATWLAAHLMAGTSLPVLNMLAGSLDTKLLNHLLADLDLPLTPEEAVNLGMSA